MLRGRTEFRALASLVLLKVAGEGAFASMTGAAEDLVAWAVSGGLEGLDQAELVAGYCERLVLAGVPLWRASIGADTLHPLIVAQGPPLARRRGRREEFYARASDPEGEQEWRESPWYQMVESGELQMRRRLARAKAPTSSRSSPLSPPRAARTIGRGSSRSASGAPSARTRPGHILGDPRPRRLRRARSGTDRGTLPAFALAFKATMAIDTAGVLVATYLGQDAAARILRGEIDRGQVKTMPKVLWFSDLTGFTRIADTLPRAQLLDLLNAYADCLVGVVHDHDGKVLKFMGDGILAVFSGDKGNACGRALDAAEAARSAMARLNRERSAAGLPVTGFTLALHQGEVLSGNVGSQDRLDFTVIGPAVNEVSRIQAMSRSLDQPILVSASFAAACGDQRKRLVSVGRYALRGVGRPQELFILDLTEPGRTNN